MQIKQYLRSYLKGQIILKELFNILEFSQKTKERIRFSSIHEFVRSFFGRIRGYQKVNYLTLTYFSYVIHVDNT